jgi:hypothetical protein
VRLVDLFRVMACVAVCKQPDAKAEISVHVARMNGNLKKMRGPARKTGGVAVVCRRRLGRRDAANHPDRSLFVHPRTTLPSDPCRLAVSIHAVRGSLLARSAWYVPRSQQACASRAADRIGLLPLPAGPNFCMQGPGSTGPIAEFFLKVLWIDFRRRTIRMCMIDDEQ